MRFFGVDVEEILLVDFGLKMGFYRYVWWDIAVIKMNIYPIRCKP
jgi:hypothetical protein